MAMTGEAIFTIGNGFSRVGKGASKAGNGVAKRSNAVSEAGESVAKRGNGTSEYGEAFAEVGNGIFEISNGVIGLGEASTGRGRTAPDAVAIWVGAIDWNRSQSNNRLDNRLHQAHPLIYTNMAARHASGCRRMQRSAAARATPRHPQSNNGEDHMTPSQMEPPLIRRSAKLNVEDLRVSKLNVRLEADPEGLDSLAESIKTVGLQHPLVVRQVPDEPDVFEVVEGSRRLRALKKLGHTTIECRIAEMDDRQALVASIHENMWRGDITAAELSRSIKMMMAMMPEHWSEQKRRGAVAQNLGWMLSNDRGKKRPNLARVKDAILMGEFQNMLPGTVIKQRTLGDAKKSTLAWSTAKQVRDIVTSPEVLPVLDAMPPEERSGYVQKVAKEYKETPSKHRAEFVRKVQATPTRPPEEIRQELDVREKRSVMVTFRADANLLGAIDDYAATQTPSTRAEVVIKLVRLGLQTAGSIT